MPVTTVLPSSSSSYIIAVDIGTTTIRSVLYSTDRCTRVFDYSEEVSVAYCGDKAEIDPEQIWEQFKTCVEVALAEVPKGAPPPSLTFCCQRSSFLTYNSYTKEPVSKLILWNDQRSKKDCEARNRSIALKAINFGSAIAHLITRQPKFKAGKILRFIGSMISFRLMLSLKEPENKQLREDNYFSYACLETWILLKLSNFQYKATEPSNCSATGMYDPFEKKYNKAVLRLAVSFKFPFDLLVDIKDTASTHQPHCYTDPAIFSQSLAVTAVLADQQAALFGIGGVKRGDTMISMGTGTFLQKNLGEKPHASMNGLYPLVAWTVDGKTTHIAEGQQHQTAALIKYAQSMNLFDDVSNSSALAESVPNSNGLFLVPAMGGLQTPYNDDLVRCALFGIKADTLPAHMNRAILESIAFRVYEIHSTMEKEIVSKERSLLRVCGGISHNDFVCQTIATLCNRSVERITDSGFAAARGAALMAGVATGHWTIEDVPSMVSVERTFHPRSAEQSELKKTFSEWQRVVKFSLGLARDQ